MATPSPSDPADGPVLSLINKRLRNLRKKLNRVLQMEDSLSKGKTLNNEQDEVLRSKPQLLALIDEYERLRSSLASAVAEELSLHHPPAPEPQPSVDPAIEDVLKLLYFAQLFDVRPQAEYETTMLLRAHERGCCITYDTVTDETMSLLEERDLDAIAVLGGAMLARGPDSDVSHRGALAECVRRAGLWLARSEQPVEPGSGFSYAGLRERLDRIWASNYSTATPEIKQSSDLAAEVGKYAVGPIQGGEQSSGVYAVGQIQGGEQSSAVGQIQGGQIQVEYEEYEPKVDDLENSGNKEIGTEWGQTDEPTEVSDTAVQEHIEASTHQDLEKLQFDDAEEQNYREGESEQQQFVPRRPYTNQRPLRNAGRRGSGMGRGGRARGSGRGYHNGRHQYYDSGYPPSNYYAPRGRNGRGGGSYNHGAPGYGGHSSSVELGAS